MVKLIQSEHMKPIPDEIMETIITPHEHEDSLHIPLWILWRHELRTDAYGMPPTIDCICDSAQSAVYHMQSLYESYTDSYGSQWKFYVERIPANHRFASSMDDILFEHHKKMASQFKYKHEGD